MGRRSGCEGMDMSMITTLFCGDVSRTQMNLSDSIVTCVKVMNCWLMPRLVNVSASFIVMGALAVAMATEDNERDAQYKLSLSLKASTKSRERKIRRKPSPVCTHAQIKRKKNPPRCTEEEEEPQQQSSFLYFRQLDLEIQSQKSIEPTRFLSQKASRSSYEIERKKTETHMIGKHQHPV